MADIRDILKAQKNLASSMLPLDSEQMLGSSVVRDHISQIENISDMIEPTSTKIFKMLQSIERDKRTIENLVGPSLANYQSIQEDILQRQNAAVGSAIDQALRPGILIQDTIQQAFRASDINRFIRRTNHELSHIFETARMGFVPASSFSKEIQQTMNIVGDALSQIAAINTAILGCPSYRLIEDSLRGAENSLFPKEPERLFDTPGLSSLIDDVNEALASLPDTSGDDALGEDQKYAGSVVESAIEALDQRFTSIEQQIAALNSIVEQLQILVQRLGTKSVLRYVIHSLIIPLVIGLASSYSASMLAHVDQRIQQLEPSSCRRCDFLRDVRREREEILIPVELTRRFRVVTESRIRVFDYSDDDDTMDYLVRGQVVEIIESEGKWRLVRWINQSTSENGEGWVMAKYIAKLTRQ